MKRQYLTVFVGTKVIGGQSIFPIFGNQDITFENRDDSKFTMTEITTIRKFLEKHLGMEAVSLLGEPFELKLEEAKKEEKK